MSEEAASASRPSRERKPTQRLAPEQAKAAKAFSYTGGVGTPLGEIALYRHATDGLPSDDEVLTMLHSIFYGSAGKHTVRKRQLRLFAGFPEGSPSRSSLVEKVNNSKKWTVSALKTAAGMFGLDKGGSRDDIVGRFVDFIIRPTELKGVPAAKSKGSKKRKATKKTKKEKGDTGKRAPSAFILYSQAKREEIKAENPEAPFGEVAKLLGVAWKALGEAEKAIWVSAAAAAASVSAEGGVKKRRKTGGSKGDSKVDEEESEAEEEEEEESADEKEEEEEGGDDRDKDLFPDSDEEA